MREHANRDLAIEGLRGLAALMVFYHHLLLEPLTGWSASPRWTWFVSGPAAVLVFFVLSGYVIGLRHRGSARAGDVEEYLRRRAIRLIPINCAAVLLTCAISQAMDWPTLLGNLFFLQNFASYNGTWILVLQENTNLWSLNYEVVFYLLFAVLWWAKIPLRWTVALMVVLGVLGWFGKGVPLFAACYAFGFLFWLAGLALAWCSKTNGPERGNWPSCLLFALLTWKLQPLAELFLASYPALPRFPGPVVKLYTLDFLPACVWLIACVGRRTFHGLALVQIVALIVPLGGLVIRFWRPPDSDVGEMAMLVAVYVAALVLWRWRPPVRWIGFFAPVGLISYALYATARPIETAIFRVRRVLPSNAWTFLACGLVTVIVALTVAWYLERRLQPALSAALRRKPKFRFGSIRLAEGS